MKNLAIFGLAAASASLATGSLWNMTVDAYQVQVPGAVSCMASAADQDAKNACYQSTGGWWFAYTGDTKDGQTYSFSPIGTNPDGTYKIETTDETDGSILPGGNLQEGVGLVVTISAAGGAAETPAVAGIGFNYGKKDTESVSVTDKTGFCLAYSWTGANPLSVELSQGPDDELAGWNTWDAKIPPATGGTANLTWDKFANGGNWGTPKTLDEVKANLHSLKVRIKNSAAAEEKGTLTISEVGYAEDGCGAGGSGTPSAIHAVAASSAKATLSGRTLSFSGINSAATYEIVSLQGQVVKSGVVSSSINLSSLNAGVYMVRVAGKSVNMNQKILVK